MSLEPIHILDRNPQIAHHFRTSGKKALTGSLAASPQGNLQFRNDKVPMLPPSCFLFLASGFRFRNVHVEDATVDAQEVDQVDVVQNDIRRASTCSAV